MIRSASLVLFVAACRFGFGDHVPSDAAIDATVFPIDATSVVGCADGEREAFADLAAYPAIAGCAATWVGELDLRAPPTGGSCGDDAATCAAPADACASGWHICARSGDGSELLALTATDCSTVSGRWVAAADHCGSFDGMACVYASLTALSCEMGESVTCTQPICCGAACDPTTQCRDEVWAGATLGNVDLGPGCANSASDGQDGVLCCIGST